jgi:hypothetical protein
MTARITDDMGVAKVTFTITDPRGWTVAEVNAYRNSGTKNDGVYRNDWASKTTSLAGRYGIYVQAYDEWQKTTGLKLVGYIDLNPIPVVVPTPTPTPTAAPKPTDAAMVVTPYYSISTSRNSALYSARAVTLRAKSSALFLASTLFASGNNFGLRSLGHLLEVTSETPSICTVTGVQTWDRTGGIYTRATVNTLAAGTCSVTWKFLGFPGRAATSTTMNVTVR